MRRAASLKPLRLSGTTTTSSGGVGAGAGYEVIKSTWEIARKNGNVAPKTLFR